MRHRVKSVKLGRTSQHRDLMLANMAGSLIQHNRIKTTLAKAKALRPLAEKLVTIGKKGGLHNRRLALARLINNEDWVKKLFGDIAPRFKERNGGYTRILKLGPRNSDAAPMALIEWVDHVVAAAPAPEDKQDAPAKQASAAEAKAE
ncbi:MAG: 50S ribosomal protein L17 [Verrucomicrobiales bacterium]|jgi:large subunit ribosomal protein L17|nr:50S ribosomal protein L17 [Verrucomicrobiales bacterium]